MMLPKLLLCTLLSMTVIANTSCAKDETEGKQATAAPAETEKTAQTKAAAPTATGKATPPTTDTATTGKHAHTWTTTEYSWADVKQNVELAITDLGLIVSGTLHVSEMMNRTGKDLGFDKTIFKHAEAVEFCSAPISHKMAIVDPANIGICPFTVIVYELDEQPGTIHVGFRDIKLEGSGAEVEKEIYATLEGIVKAAIE